MLAEVEAAYEEFRSVTDGAVGEGPLRELQPRGVQQSWLFYGMFGSRAGNVVSPFRSASPTLRFRVSG